MRFVRVAFFAASVLFLVGCQSPDVGQRCDIEWGLSPLYPAPTPQTTSSDYLETGNPTCDSLVCVVSHATSGEYASCAAGTSLCGYCSKPCVSDAECYKSETGLVCRQMVLDPAFIAQLDPALAEKYLGDARYSSYCAVPLQ